MTSGNLTADRRFEYARMLREIDDPAGAADVIAQALELVPTWPEGHFALAEALAHANRKADAISAYHAYLALDPADSMGAGLRLGLLEPDAVPTAMPEAYVRRLFDEYAPRFDKSLMEGLAYRAPEALRTIIDKLFPHRRFTAMLDLGCGTGLAGAAFRPITTWLEGIDLSERMVAEAQRKEIYDRLAVGDMSAHLTDSTRDFDLIVAADVLVYLGALDDLFAAIRRKITNEGVFAFTVQRADTADFRLGQEHRYSHSRTYIAACAQKTGFAALLLEDGAFRREKGVDVPGLLAVLRPI
jgi:predicted TPR repeat methyltransferase